MGLYIGGMEMPKDGNWITLRIFPDGECSLYSWCGTDFDFMGHLTAVPVPPHGRLIDADAYEKLLRGLGNRDYRRESGTLQDAIKCLHPHYSPTIIPAEE